MHGHEPPRQKRWVSDVVARDIIGRESEAVSRIYTHIDTEYALTGDP
jgi:hypothetical protein